MRTVTHVALAACVGYSVCVFADGERVALGAGSWSAFDDTTYGAASLGVEGREIPALWSLRPAFQIIYQPDDTYYVGLGPVKEFSISDDWSWGLGVAAGYYHKGDGQDLGEELEFHSRVMVSYQLNTANRLRAELGHLSNAELDDVNPGTEFVSMNWVYAF